MKIVSSTQMANLEEKAYHNGASKEDFMEKAGQGIAEAVDCFANRHSISKNIFLLCGKGNNGGDAYVAGTYLLNKNYNVTAFQIIPIEQASLLSKKNHNRFLASGGQFYEINQSNEMVLPQEGIILDALFGTGFKGFIKEPFASVIHRANNSGLPILSVDIPSGLCGESGIVEGEAIKAKETFFLGLPKLGFFLQDGWNHVGKLRFVDFGLPKQLIEELETDMTMINFDCMKSLLPQITNNRHKYQAGLVVGLAGSPGMSGAAILSSMAALRGGAGIVRLLYPIGMEAELSFSPHELIKLSYLSDEHEKILETLNGARATFIGPGIGRNSATRSLLQTILPKLEKPCVIDADALTIIAEEKINLPKGAVITPHLGEVIRLLKISVPRPSTKEFLEICQEYVERKNITLVLKGGPTFIFHPDKSVVVNPYGDPGMATAGSGDVLTGLIAALLAQGLTQYNAAKLGVFLHGISGEYAAEKKTSYCMIASDIIAHFSEGFRFYEKKHRK
jgi:hydroxyethylthiazole kinase-like uncharacterized protein yjeF